MRVGMLTQHASVTVLMAALWELRLTLGEGSHAPGVGRGEDSHTKRSKSHQIPAVCPVAA